MGQSQFKKEQQECLELIKNQKFLESLQFLENMENNNNNQVNIREFVSFQKGLCYMGLNKHVQAIECFEKCYDVQSKINICQILMKINKFDKAKSLLQELNRNSENNSLILQLNGSYLLFADKNYQEAAQKFEQSLALNGNQFDTYYNLAKCYQIMKQLDKAKQYLEKSLQINPKFKASLQMRKWFNLYLVSNLNCNVDDYFDLSNFLNYCKKLDYQDDYDRYVSILNIYKSIYLYDLFLIYLETFQRNFQENTYNIQSYILFMIGNVLSALNKYSLAFEYYKQKLELEKDVIKKQAVKENIALCLLYQRNYQDSITILDNQKEREKSQILLLCIYLCQYRFQEFIEGLQNNSMNKFRNIFIFYFLQKYYLQKNVEFYEYQDQIKAQIQNQQFILGKLYKEGEDSENQHFFQAAQALLKDENRTTNEQNSQSENFDCLYYSDHLIQVKQFLQKKPVIITRSINSSQLIYQNNGHGVTVTKFIINNKIYLKKKFKLQGNGELITFIPQQVVNELLIGSFCIGSYVNYNLFYDCYQDEHKNSYVVIYQNYYSEGSLQEYLKNNKLTKFQKQQIVFRIIKGLQQLHSKSINHLDLKLLNIVIQKQQSDGSINPIIIDYGASIINLNPLNLIYKGQTDNIAFQQIQFQTPSYKIPENQVDNRSDIFNLGKIILEVYSNSYLNLLHDFKIDTSFIIKNEISNQLLKYIQEEIRNKEIFERPNTELILYEFQKDYLFDFLYSCLIDQSLIDYQLFMTQMYNHFNEFWISLFQKQNHQQQNKPKNFIFENKELICHTKINQMMNISLLIDILFDNRLLYYFVHGVLKILQVKDYDIDTLIEKIEQQKNIYLEEDQQLIVQIEQERKTFKDMIQQINGKQEFIEGNKLESQIHNSEQGDITISQNKNFKQNQELLEKEMNQLTTVDYRKHKFQQNMQTTTKDFNNEKFDYKIQENTNIYFKDKQ